MILIFVILTPALDSIELIKFGISITLINLLIF